MTLKNLVAEFLVRHNMKVGEFADAIGVNRTTAYGYKYRTYRPNKEIAWKIHTFTKGEIPIGYWGYELVNGKTKRKEWRIGEAAVVSRCAKVFDEN